MKSSVEILRKPVPPGTDGDDRGVHEYTLAFEDLGMTPDAVALAMGYKPGAMPEHFADEIGELLSGAESRVQAKGGFRIFLPQAVHVGEEDVTCGGVTFLTGRVLAAQLVGCDAAAVFVATAGPLLEEWSHALMAEGDMMRGFLVDSIGSVTVERVADFLESRIESTVADNGWRLSNRYSPGYCGWTVAEQHKLFSLLPEEFCNIRLTESALMTPIKSVSGMVGLGPNAQRLAYECSLCELRTCFRRSSRLAAISRKGKE